MEKITKKEELCLVGKLHSKQTIGKKVVKAKMENIRKVGKFSFQNIHPNLFIIKFDSTYDKNRVLGENHGFFINTLLAFQPFDGMIQPHLMSFDRDIFWV